LEAVCLWKPETGWSEARGFLKEQINDPGDPGVMEPFLESIQRGISSGGKNYIGVIKGLEPEASIAGTRWLQGIVDHIIAGARAKMPTR
ncbi:MAG: hypothetical protein P8X85_02660, partial [Desulfobacterales bacterium]